MRSGKRGICLIPAYRLSMLYDFLFLFFSIHLFVIFILICDFVVSDFQIKVLSERFLFPNCRLYRLYQGYYKALSYLFGISFSFFFCLDFVFHVLSIAGHFHAVVRPRNSNKLIN